VNANEMGHLSGHNDVAMNALANGTSSFSSRRWRWLLSDHLNVAHRMNNQSRILQMFSTEHFQARWAMANGRPVNANVLGSPQSQNTNLRALLNCKTQSSPLIVIP
jgi:hypothetical protein